MYIYLPEVKQKKGEAADYRFEEDLSEIFEDFPDGGTLKMWVSVSCSADKVLINGSFDAVLKVVCSRCLERFEHHFKTDFSEAFSLVRELSPDSTPASLAAETANMYTVAGDFLYLEEYIRQLIILAQEPSPLCKPECKGLCAGCGTDLNKSSCSCDMDDEAVDIRLLKLKEFKKG
ncbi:MAG: YceD family protein [Bacillota bacterium]